MHNVQLAWYKLFFKNFYIIGSCKVWDPDPKNNLDPDPAGSEKVGSVPSLV